MCLTPYPVPGQAGVQSRNLEHVPAWSQPWAWSALLWNAFTEPSSAWMLHDFTQHSAFASINIYHLPWQLSSLQRKSRRVLKKEVKSDSKKLFLGIPWRNNPGQYVKQQYFYLPRGILCLESTRLHWFLFRALYVIKKHHLRFVFFILYLLSFFKLRICLVAVWRCSSAGVGASSGSPITSPSHPATWNFWMLCSPTGWKVRQSPRVEVLPRLVFTRLLCVCAQTGTPSAAAKLVQVEPQPEQSPAEDLLCGWSNIKNFRSSLQPWKCCFEVSGPSHVLQTFISCAGVFFVRLFGVFLKISGKVSTN